MASLLRFYAQRDNRVEPIALTGYVKNNGTATSSPPQIEQPAYGAIDLRVSKNFTLDASVLQLRTDPPTDGLEYVVRLYLSSNSPPQSYPNYEFNVIVTVPNKGTGHGGIGTVLFLNIYTNKTAAYTLSNSGTYQLINAITTTPPYVVQGTFIITFEVVNNTIVLKTLPYGFTNASI